MCLNQRKFCREDKLTKKLQSTRPLWMSIMRTCRLSGHFTGVFQESARVFAEST